MTTIPNGKKRMGKFARHFLEAALATGFVISFVAGKDLVAVEGVTTASRLMGALVPVSLLTIWFLYYFFQIRRMDELERYLEVLSLAVAGGVCMWIVIVWGTLSAFMQWEEADIMLAAPIVAGVYGLIRGFMMVRYR
ncbi:hypothetical protein [Gimibacter soli]|uniref:Uncharacterized protein n=1 Tax=Gimibacter soli TaxID=3024400 RepID=A0AAF0BKW3_9PROT|nr:hypothetical protein [Gimibacter soli]WCL52755.1 hypothetical protein PH603_09410 [Gimibacter soli]